MNSSKNPTQNKSLLVMMGVVIVVVTGGIIAIGYFLFQGLDDNSKQLNAMKIRRETAATPMMDIVPFLSKKTGMAEQHPLCEKLFREAEELRRQLLYQKALERYEQSKQAYLADIGKKPLDSIDKLHLSVRDSAIGTCYIGMKEYSKALVPCRAACEEYPSEKYQKLLADI